MGANSLSNEEFILRSIKIHGEKFLYNKTIYKNQKTKILICCKLHGEFETLPYNHFNQSGGCKKCCNILNGSSHKSNTKTFIEKAIKVHGNLYDYSKTIYEHSLKYIIVICPNHGEFKIKPSNHINNKQGCKLCGIIKIKNSNIKDLDIFLEQLKLKKGFENYDFSNITSIQNRHKDIVKCICKIHGEYNTTPRNILRSNFFACRECKLSNDRFDTQTFIQICSKIHNNYYNYDKINYIKSHEKVTVTCPKHGDYECSAYIHIGGGGFCPKCTNYVSSYEIEVFDFIQSIGIENLKSSVRNIDGIKEIDIFCEKYKLGIEFDGLYWHSEYFKENNYHLDKTKKMNNLGYRLIHIFEDEWLFKRNICESIIRNSFNKISNKIYARKCSIKEVSYKECEMFLDLNHIQGNCVSKYRYGLYHNNELVSIMTFGNLRKNLGTDSKFGDYELLRFCNKTNTSIVGAASKLFKHFISTINPNKIISFCDIRYGTGNVYKLLGFNFLYSTNPNYYYIKNGKRYNRFSFRKDILISKGYDANKSEKDIMKDLGYYRIYDCGSMKFEWNAV